MQRVRQLALALPETTEEPHHDLGSFRVRGKIFATVPDDQHIRIMVGEDEVAAACAASPSSCEPLYWGKHLRGVEVTVRSASSSLIAELLADAWHRKAPPGCAARRSLTEPRCTNADRGP